MLLLEKRRVQEWIQEQDRKRSGEKLKVPEIIQEDKPDKSPKRKAKKKRELFSGYVATSKVMEDEKSEDEESKEDIEQFVKVETSNTFGENMKNCRKIFNLKKLIFFEKEINYYALCN